MSSVVVSGTVAGEAEVPAREGLGMLPIASGVLAVCAHPDDESFGLGAVLHRLAEEGVHTSVLCFTRGEASTLGTVATGLPEIRQEELLAAAHELHIDRVEILDHPDGALSAVPLEDLVDAVTRALAAANASLLLVFDEGGVTGHPDHQHATEAALAGNSEVPVLAWCLPAAVGEALNAEFATAFVGRDEHEIDLELTVDREAQRSAIACHSSQSTDNPVLRRRLELLGQRESLRWLRRLGSPAPGIDAPAAVAAGANAKEA